mgnify:CR=1 FL=1|jgi:hypothetical protein|tara:strand:- start:2022 stop:2210 length:189 start_codon:yes stop_codon:yes gene_type:complete
MTNGSVDYSLGHLKADMENLDERFDKLELKVDSLSVWRFKTIGFVAGVTAVANGIVVLVFNV